MADQEYHEVYGQRIPINIWNKYKEELEVFREERKAIWAILDEYSIGEGLEILLMTAVEVFWFASRDEDDKVMPDFFQSRASTEAIQLQRMLHDMLTKSTGSEGWAFFLALSYLHQRIHRRIKPSNKEMN